MTPTGDAHAPRHPEHDAVRAEVRSWYTASTPEIGFSVVPASYGFLSDAEGRPGSRRLVMTVDAIGEVAPALAAARAFYGASGFDVWLDDRVRAERLTPTLVAAGYAPVQDTVVLARVGPVLADRGPGHLEVEECTDQGGLAAWVRVKLQGFADDEGAPDPDRERRELDQRTAEWPVCTYQLARLDSEGVAVLGAYRGRDEMVFNLATRLPFRHRGIARSLLARWSEEDGTAVRSRLINCDDGGPADALYRRLGFTDEVYWHRRFSPVV